METIKLAYNGKNINVMEWDGTAPRGYKLDDIGSRRQTWADDEKTRLMIDACGNVYYMIRDGRGMWATWCSAGQLAANIVRINQINARRVHRYDWD